MNTDTRAAALCIQCDNSARENKNNTVLRLAGLLTGLHRIKRCEVRFLRKGHSHEDIDMFFASVSNLLQSSPELHVPQDFVNRLQSGLIVRTSVSMSPRSL